MLQPASGLIGCSVIVRGMLKGSKTIPHEVCAIPTTGEGRRGVRGGPHGSAAHARLGASHVRTHPTTTLARFLVCNCPCPASCVASCRLQGVCQCPLPRQLLLHVLALLTLDVGCAALPCPASGMHLPWSLVQRPVLKNVAAAGTPPSWCPSRTARASSRRSSPRTARSTASGGPTGRSPSSPCTAPASCRRELLDTPCHKDQNLPACYLLF